MRNSIIERNFLNIPTDRTININRNLKNYSSNNIFWKNFPFLINYGNYFI